MGIVGYFFWLGLIILFFAAIFRIRKNFIPTTQEEQDTLQLFNVIEASMVGFLTSAYFLSRSYQFYFYLFLGLSPAMVFITKKMRPDFNFVLQKKDWLLLTQIVFGSVVFLYLATKLLWGRA
jgi:hypothetical protein